MLGSRANGPGRRDVYWFAGCSIRCPGCTNPHLLSGGAGLDVELGSLVDLVKERAPSIEGITLSGGEPSEQADAATVLSLTARDRGLGVVLFTGRTPAALAGSAALRALRDACDLIVAGPYIAARPSNAPLLGSSNQSLIFVTGRYSPADLADIPRVEWQVGVAGFLETGVG